MNEDQKALAQEIYLQTSRALKQVVQEMELLSTTCRELVNSVGEEIHNAERFHSELLIKVDSIRNNELDQTVKALRTILERLPAKKPPHEEDPLALPPATVAMALAFKEEISGVFETKSGKFHVIGIDRKKWSERWRWMRYVVYPGVVVGAHFLWRWLEHVFGR